jgi:DNA-binding transcriptional regulator YhcF (GntR family)
MKGPELIARQLAGAPVDATLIQTLPDPARTIAQRVASANGEGPLVGLDPVAALCITPTQRAALELYDLGFNVGPVKPASKQPFKWRAYATSRLQREYLPELFAGRVGVFVLTGRTSRSLFILDCETERAAAQHRAEFAAREIAPWEVKTARGAHFWLLSAEGEAANVKHESGAWEIRGNLRYCLCPPSVHPSGVIYEWAARPSALPPMVRLAELDWLSLRPAMQARNKPDAPAHEASGELVCLSRSTREFIKSGAPAGTRNTRLFSAACDLAGNEYAQSQARELLLPAATACGLSRKEAAATIQSAYSQPRNPAKQSGAKYRPARWQLAARFAEGHRWKALTHNGVTVTGDTLRRVFLACCERARRDNAPVFRATAREVAELAGVKADTANRALNCLIAHDYLKLADYSAVGARLFVFGGVCQKGDSTPTWTVSSVPFLSQAHDAFQRGGLGSIAERVWRSTLTLPATAKELAARLNATPRSVYRALGKLATFGLVEQDAGGRYGGLPATAEDLGRIAAAVGTAGRGQKRREKHTAERARRVSELTRRARLAWERRQGLHGDHPAGGGST